MGNKMSRLWGASSSKCHEAEATQEEIQKISDALYKFHEPKPAMSANLDIFFFHGLQCEGAHVQDAHILPWRSTAETREEEEIWPRKWLPEDFPQARIISVRYDCSSKQTDTEGRMDLYLIGENLVQEMMRARKHGYDRPVILVGHGFGGIVLKRLCVHAQEKKQKATSGKDMDMFLESRRGFFFYAAPHLGVEGMKPLAENEGPLLRWMRILNSESSRLHEAFSEMWRARRYRWTIYGLGGVESTLERHGLRVPEASTRFGDAYITVPEDHFSVCRPFGKHDNRYQHLHNLIEDVRRQVELERKPPEMVPEVTVGVDGLLTEILGKRIRDHKFLGFFGMGGVGKTTLAKLIFNKMYAKFEFSCFVEEIKQIPGTKDKVRKKVWEKMLRHGLPVSSASGSSGAGEWYQVTERSLFVVFDDVQDIDHVKLLKEIAHDNGMGESRFLLTSRDMNRLRDCGNDIYICQLDTLEDEDANKLFITHAFPGQQQPPESLRLVVKQVVDGCEGLPLTLEVLGNYLRDKTEIKHWEEIPAALRKCDKVADLDEKVWGKLQLSYDRLPEDEVKYMFLDIASFFVCNGVDLSFSVDDAISAWTSVYGTGRNRLQTLQDRALVKVISSGKDSEGADITEFYMHEHLRKMGQRIARLEGRSFDLSRGQSLATSSTCDPWHPNYCPSGMGPNNYPLDDQVIVQGAQELEKIIAHRVWIQQNRRFCNFWRSGTNVLDDTTGTSVLTRCTSLVYLHLAMCNIVDLGGLKKLHHLWSLQIIRCAAVRNWPASLRELTNLKRLDVSSIDEPFELPSTFGNLTNLEHLSVESCEVNSVPSSLQNLTRLRVLKVSRVVGRQAIPDIIAYLRQLRILKLECWGIVNLVGGLRELTALRELSLTCEGIVELPDTFGSLTSLEELKLRCPISCLPASFSNLTRLKRLELDGRFGKVDNREIHKGFVVVRLREDEIVYPIFPLFHHLQGFLTKQNSLHLHCQHGMSAIIVRNMISLESLKLFVTGPEAVLDIFGDLRKLRIFKLKCEAMENSLVESLDHLSSLEEIDLACRTVEQLPDIFGCFSTLKTLRIECPSLQALPDTFGNFIQLTTVRIGGSGLRRLPDSFVQLSQLREFHLRGCNTLTTLPDLGGCSSSLVRLCLGAWEISRLQPQIMWQLPQLKELKICGRYGSEYFFDPVNSHPEEHLQHLPETIWQMSHMESLLLSDVPKLTTLGEALGNLHSLQKLELWSCAIESLPESLGRLSSLTHLKIFGCRNLESLPDTIGGLSSLTFVDSEFSSPLHSFPESLGPLSGLTHLEITGCDNLQTLPATIGRLSRLRSLVLMHLHKLTTLPETLGNLHSLQELELGNCAIESLPKSFGRLSDLTYLKIHACYNLKTLPDTIGGLASLISLTFAYTSALRTLPESLGRLPCLKDLDLHDCVSLKTLPETIGDLSSLGSLDISASGLRSLPNTFGGLSNLISLSIGRCENLKLSLDTIARLLPRTQIRN